MNNRVLIGNLATSVNEEQIVDLFLRVKASFVSITIPNDPKTGNNRGYAYVEMESPAAAEHVLKTLNGQDLSGRTLQITSAGDHPEDKPIKGKWYKFGAV